MNGNKLCMSSRCSKRRSGSGGESMMERRMEEERRKKLEDKLARLWSSEERSGGTLKVYGARLDVRRPYKSLLLSTDDSAAFVVAEMLDKYGVGREREREWCLIAVPDDGEEDAIRLRRWESPLRLLATRAGGLRFEIARKPLRRQNTMPEMRPRADAPAVHLHTATIVTEPPSPPEIGGPPLPSYHEVVRLVRPQPRHGHSQQQQQQQDLVTSSWDCADSQSRASCVIQPPPPPPHRSLKQNVYRSEEEQLPDQSDLDWFLSRHLPLQLTYFRSKEEVILDAVIMDLRPPDPPPLDLEQLSTENNDGDWFPLFTAYTLHLMTVDIVRCCRTATQSSLESESERVSEFVSRAVSRLHKVVARSGRSPLRLSYWLANATEWLHLLRQNCLLPRCQSYLDEVAAVAQLAFRRLAQLLLDSLPNGLSEAPVWLASHMRLLGRSLLNPALTLQLAARLVHGIDRHILLTLLRPNSSSPTHEDLTSGLAQLRTWAANHELASLVVDRYTQPITAAASLLTLLANQDSPSALEPLYELCLRLPALNSLQIRAILLSSPSRSRSRIPQIWVDFITTGVRQVADRVWQDEGRALLLEPPEELGLPLLLPEDGYHVETLSWPPYALQRLLMATPAAGAATDCGLLPAGVCFCSIVSSSPSTTAFSKERFYDWLCRPASPQDSPLSTLERCIQAVAMPTELATRRSECSDRPMATADSSIGGRHQLQLTDFKKSFTTDSHSDSALPSTAESGIDTDRNPNSNDSLSTTAACELFPDSTLSSSNRSGDETMGEEEEPELTQVRCLRDDVQAGEAVIGRALEQYSLVEERIEEQFQHRLVSRLEEWTIEKKADECANHLQQDRLTEQRSQAFLRYRAEKDMNRDVQLSRMQHIADLEHNSLDRGRGVWLANSCSLTRSPSSLTSRLDPKGMVRSQISGSMDKHQGRPRSASLRTPTGIRHHRSVTREGSGDSTITRSTPGTPSRSISADRYNWLMTQDLDKLDFQEKLDLFEFGVLRSKRYSQN